MKHRIPYTRTDVDSSQVQDVVEWLGMIDKMQMPTVPAQWDDRDCFTMWEKIQELVEKVNELERRIGENDETH